MEVDNRWTVLLKITDVLSSLAMIFNLVSHSVYVHPRKPIITDVKGPNLLEHVSFQGGFVALGTRKCSSSHFLHKVCFRARTGQEPQLFQVYLFLPNRRHLEDKDPVVSITGSASAGDKTSWEGHFVDSRDDGTSWH